MPGLLKKIELILWPDANGHRESNDPIDILKESYRELSRLAAQISDHAARAPYPGVAQTLRRIAEEKQSAAKALRNKLEAMGGTLYETTSEIESGGNHWERMGRDLNAHGVLEMRFLARAARLNEKAPDTAELLQQVVQMQSHHVRILNDLIARADPQAQQT
ncbi:MAG TPA: hypothetical protein VKH64_04530 [Candidatus Binatia bacterium]|nr:hypothetical protein [Candidatus Binatia bacterium]